MKKLIALLTVFALAGAFTACNKNKSTATGNTTTETTAETTTTKIPQTTLTTEKTSSTKKTPTTTQTQPPQTTANTAPTTQNTTAVSETEETTPKTAEEEYKQRINSMANSLYISAESLVSVYQTVGIEFDRDYYYSNDNTEFSKQISERLGTVRYPDGEIFDYSDGWAVAITTEGYNNIEPETVIGAVVAGKNNMYGRYPNNPTAEKSYTDIETALKDTAAYFLSKPTIISN
jgi:hypothetical protein